MSIKKTLASLLVAGAVALGVRGKANAETILYDDFSSGTLNTQKWDVRQDYEGWSFMDEQNVDATAQNFHTQTNTARDTGAFLVPTHKFSAGEIFEYDVIYNGGTGNHVNSVFVNQSNRFGTVGYWNEGDPTIGIYHIKLEFGDSWIRFNDTNQFNLSGSLPYEVYIGTRTGHNGTGHFDYDNFYIDVVPEPSTLGLLATGCLASVSIYTLNKRRKENGN